MKNRIFFLLENGFQAISLLAFTLLFFPSCQEIQSEKSKGPQQQVSTSRSSITGVSGETGVALAVTVRLMNANGGGISRLTPTITAVTGAGSDVAGISGGSCTVGDSLGYSTCTITSSVSGTYFLKVTSPAVFTGGAITFSPVTRSLSFHVQPSGTSVSGAVFAVQPVVRLLDRQGNLNTSGTDTVTLTLTTPAGATLSGNSVVAGVAGVVTFSLLEVDKSGAYTLTATSGSMSTISTSFTITADVATKVVFTTEPSSSSPANIAFSQQPILAIQDASGNTVTSSTCLVTLSLTATPNAGDALLGTVSKSAVSGIVDFAGLNLRISSSVGGTGYVITATPQGACAALTVDTTDAFAITTAGVPYQLVLSQSPSTAALNQIWPTQPIVQVLDVNGDLVSTDNNTVVSLVAGAGSPGGTLNGSTSIQVVNGVATFTGLSVNSAVAGNAGTYNWEFDAVNSNVPSLNFTMVPYAHIITSNGLTGTKLVFQTQPTNVSINQSQPDFTVKVEDANGYLCFTCSTSVTISLFSGAGALAGTATQTAVGGIATFSGISFNTAGTKQLDAQAGGMTTGYSNNFGVSNFGTSSKLAFGTQPSAGASTGQTAWATQPTVQIQDAAGNVVTNNNTGVVTLTCANASATCTLIGTTTVQAVNGVATFTNLRTQQTGLTGIVLEATATGLTTTQSNSFTGNTP